jgi:hypothetical protein
VKPGIGKVNGTVGRAGKTDPGKGFTRRSRAAMPEGEGVNSGMLRLHQNLARTGSTQSETIKWRP